ncbi:MAG TPA: iron dependent repressor, metal binding and dimerization domain protein [Chloroflexota bacterium]|nr:iron dependent repressor, metal binding and dimerization domain protein [Chloroflexota bacterium]
MRKHDLGQWVAEDYVAAIATLEADGRTVIGARLAEFFGVTPPTVTDIIQRLQKRGYVEFGAAKEIHLTEAGRELAQQTLRTRRIAERFFVDALGLSLAEARDEADRLEHALSPDVTERLSHALGDPETCPHGEPISGAEADPTFVSTTLDRAPVAVDLVLERVGLEARADADLTLELAELGLVPGSRLTVQTVGPEGPTIRGADGVRLVSARAARALVVRQAQPGHRFGDGDTLEPRFHMTVKSVQGTCLAGHRAGDDFAFGHCAPAGLCLDALQRVLPALSALRLGDRPGTIQVPCPDDGIVTFTVERSANEPAAAESPRRATGRTGARRASGA